MAERTSWRELRDRRMSEPGADDTHQAARIAYELGCKVRELREQRGWSQTALAQAAGMTQPAVARFESGGTVSRRCRCSNDSPGPLTRTSSCR